MNDIDFYKKLQITILGTGLGFAGKKGKVDSVLRKYKPKEYFSYNDKIDMEDEEKIIDEIKDMEKILGGKKNG